MRLNNIGYIERKSHIKYRDEFLVKMDSRGNALISLGKTVFLPFELLGKKVKLKMEVLPYGRNTAQDNNR